MLFSGTSKLIVNLDSYEYLDLYLHIFPVSLITI